MNKDKVEIGRLEIVCYEDDVSININGDTNAIIAGLAVIIQDESKANPFNNLMKTAIAVASVENGEPV